MKGLLVTQVWCLGERRAVAPTALYVSPEGALYSDPAELDDADREAAQMSSGRQRRAEAEVSSVAPTAAPLKPSPEGSSFERAVVLASGAVAPALVLGAGADRAPLVVGGGLVGAEGPPATLHDLLLFPRGRTGETFFRGWAELLASDGEDTILHEMDQEILSEPPVPWWPQNLSGGLLAGLTAAAVLFMMLIAAYASALAASRESTECGRRSTKELVGLCCFRFYSGLLMCTWLPFVLAEEGASLMPTHQAMFMGVGKLILGCAMVLCPIFGLLNDQTVHPWGRRRAWFLGGIGALMVGILGCAWASEQNAPHVYLFATIIWCCGEALAESTTEALVPDLVASDDWLRAGSVRGILFMLGGFFGYGAIILQATVFRSSHSVFYMYYLVVIFITVPFVCRYATPTEAEFKVIDDYAARERARQPLLAPGAVPEEASQVPGDQAAVSDIEAAERSKTYFQRCYVECMNASPEFRLTSFATFFLAMSCTGMMFILLIMRDVVGLRDPAQIEYHMAGGSLVLLSSAVIMSVLIGVIGVSKEKQVPSLLVFCVFFALSEFALAFAFFLSSPQGRLLFLYGVGVFKGLAFGGIYNIMQPVTWEFIPEMWRSGTGSVARAMAWISVCRSVGVGVGNFIGGFILDWAKTHSTQQLREDEYPLSGYIALFIFTGSCSCLTIVTIMVLSHRQEKLEFDQSALPPGAATSAQ